MKAQPIETDNTILECIEKQKIAQLEVTIKEDIAWGLYEKETIFSDKN